MTPRKIAPTLVLAACAAALGAAAWASGSERTDRPQAAANQADLTMAQAVTLAEAKLNARVVKARLDEDAAAPVFKLDLVTTGNDRVHARVAARGGQLLDDTRERQKDSR